MMNIIVTLGHFLAMHEAGVSTCVGHCPISWFSLPSLVPAALRHAILPGALSCASALDQFGRAAIW